MKHKHLKNILIMLAVTAAAGFILKAFQHPEVLHEKPREAKVVYGSIQRSITATGAVQPQNRIEMKPPIA